LNFVKTREFFKFFKISKIRIINTSATTNLQAPNETHHKHQTKTAATTDHRKNCQFLLMLMVMLTVPLSDFKETASPGDAAGSSDAPADAR